MNGISGLYQNTKGAIEAHKNYKPFYSEYVRHCLRFYTRNLQQPHFRSNVDKTNWLACASVLKNYSDGDRHILLDVYSGFDTLPDNVYEISKKLGIGQGVIWEMMKEVERKIARRRGLI